MSVEREESWCSYQRAQARNEAFQHDYRPLPSNVLDAIRPIYNDLSKETLLERCVGGFNQNNNESFNQLIWKISPKIVSSGAIVVNLAAYIAVGHQISVLQAASTAEELLYGLGIDDPM